MQDAKEETGWKLISGDVFRAPPGAADLAVQVHPSALLSPALLPYLVISGLCSTVLFEVYIGCSLCRASIFFVPLPHVSTVCSRFRQVLTYLLSIPATTFASQLNL